MLERKKFKYWAVLLPLAIVAPFVLTNPYYKELLVLCCVYAMLGLSLDIILSGMGQITFGHQVFFALGGYASALITLKLGVSVWIGFLVATVLSGIFGLIVGYICLRRLRAMGLAMVTFALGSILWLLARQWYEVTGGMSGLANLPKPSLFGMVLRSETSYYYLALGLLLVLLYFLYTSRSSRMGRACTSLSENEALATSIGVSAHKHYTIWFGIACAIAGLAGAVNGHDLTVVNPMLFGFQYMVAMFIVLLVGGRNTLGGPVLGAIVYVWGSELLRFNEELRFAMFGAIVFIVIVFMPNGIYPTVVTTWSRLTSSINTALARRNVNH